MKATLPLVPNEYNTDYPSPSAIAVMFFYLMFLLKFEHGLSKCSPLPAQSLGIGDLVPRVAVFRVAVLRDSVELFKTWSLGTLNIGGKPSNGMVGSPNLSCFPVLKFDPLSYTCSATFHKALANTHWLYCLYFQPPKLS